MRILITGAAGFIGSRLAVAALNAGHEVRTITRRDWPGRPVVPRAARFFGELPFGIPAAAFDGVEVVVHCAASASPSQRQCEAVNVLGSLRVAEAAQAAHARALVFLSSQSARPDAVSAYGRTKEEAAAALLKLSGLDVVILRPGLVAGRGGLFGRLVRSVETLPLLPVIGQNAPVQPICVDDLVAAILCSAEDSAALAGSVICLGTERSVRLTELLAEIGRALPKGGARQIPIPLRPLEMAVSTAERLRVSLPINSGNLAGLRLVQPMKTRDDARRVGLPERSLAEIVHLALADRLGEAAPDQPGPNHGAARTLLVGAGRVGVVHAATLSRQPGAMLAGIVDLNPSARRLVVSTGVDAPGYASLEQALQAGHFDAAVIATPPSSHLRLATTCLAHGLATLVEKPACITADQVPSYQRLSDEYPAMALVGYLMPRIPHIQSWTARVRRGELGRVQGFLGITLLSLILQPNSNRWETRREVSGGGVLANSAGHVLSMISTTFGAPRATLAESLQVVSTSVEDTVVARFDYDGFSGTHVASWCIEGFPRQENRLLVWTDLGTLTLSGSMAVWQPKDGPLTIDHQLDYDVGFNLAPDYAGAGFAREIADLAGHTPVEDRMTLDRALQVETLLFSLYAGMRPVQEFRAPSPAAPEDAAGHGRLTLGEPPVSMVPAVAERQPRLVLDLRDLGNVTPDDLRQMAAGSEWAEMQVFSRQMASAASAWGSSRTRVTVPDFLGQTRLLTDKRYAQVLRSFGARGLAGAALTGALSALRERNAGFWVAAAGLLAGDLASIPSRFDGTVLLHPYIVDLALALGSPMRLEDLLRTVRRTLRHARLGVHSNLGRIAANAIAIMDVVPDVVSVLASPDSSAMSDVQAWLAAQAGTRHIRVTAEVGPGPLIAHHAAAQHPTRWSKGADAILVSGLVEPRLFGKVEAVARAQWTRAFGAWPFPVVVW